MRVDDVDGSWPCITDISCVEILSFGKESDPDVVKNNLQGPETVILIITLTLCSDEGEIQVFMDARNIVYQLSPSPGSFALDCLCSSLDVSVIQMAGSISVSRPPSSSLQMTQHVPLGSSSLITSFVKMSV